MSLLGEVGVGSLQFLVFAVGVFNNLQSPLILALEQLYVLGLIHDLSLHVEVFTCWFYAYW